MCFTSIFNFHLFHVFFKNIFKFEHQQEQQLSVRELRIKKMTNNRQNFPCINILKVKAALQNSSPLFTIYQATTTRYIELGRKKRE